MSFARIRRVYVGVLNVFRIAWLHQGMILIS